MKLLGFHREAHITIATDRVDAGVLNTLLSSIDLF